ncbi:MAG: beta-ketoacyl-[acyl-carrier-protein] synthase family protein, partial [Planctomycetota bacterium]|nr:beta-ketoacyl-[acyl-carrier-protein] synthase family protein [Planctomycetota bacterium]
MADSPSRIVITGMGLISPIGNSPQSVWDSLMNQRSGVAPLESLPTEHLPTKVAGEAREFKGQIDDFGPMEKKMARTIKKGLKVMCREIEMGVAVSQLALADSGFVKDEHDPDRVGVVYGSDYILTLPGEFSVGIQKCLNEQGRFDFTRWADNGLPGVQPLWLLKYLPNMPASHIAIYNDLRGPNNSITIREASSNLAIGEAVTTIQRGWADQILAGATGTRVHQLRTLHVVLQEQIAPGESDAGKTCRPFDLHRTGEVLGEGAAAMMLESLEFAEKRGAEIFGEVVGHASSAAIDRQGVANYRQAFKNVMTNALKSAGMQPSEIGHVHAHGLATSRCDREEAVAIHEIFNESETPVVAAKSFTGNLGAASGLVEAISSLLAIRENQLFGTLNYETPDPDCPIRISRECGNPGDSVLNLSITPQGQASAVIIR